MKNNPCLVIAEAGLNHNGSMTIAKQLIDVAAASGADIVKFQKRNVATLATGQVLDAKDERFPSLGNTYRQVRSSLEFSFEQFRELKAHCEAKGIRFLCTAFDTESTDFLEKLGVDAYKLASHSVTNVPLLRYIADIGKSVYMSTGMCSWDELDTAVNIFKAKKTPLTLFHCVSVYPTPPDDCNLRMITVLKERYGIPVGFSGHEIGYLPTLIAVGMGACAVERHITLDKRSEGFDHKISLEPAELAAMVKEIRTVEKCLGPGVKEVTEREKVTRNKYHVSMVSACAIPSGAALTQEMVVYKNPGTGIPFKEAGKVLGKKAVQEIPADTLLQPEMFR